MSKEQEQNENIKSFTDYVDEISSDKNKEEATIFGLAIVYAGINFDIRKLFKYDEKADLQKSLSKKYKLDNQSSLSEIIDNITGQAIDNFIKNNYQVNVFDIDNAITLLPEKLVMKVIAETNSEYLKIENFLSLKDIDKELNIMNSNNTNKSEININNNISNFNANNVNSVIFQKITNTTLNNDNKNNVNNVIADINIKTQNYTNINICNINSNLNTITKILPTNPPQNLHQNNQLNPTKNNQKPFLKLNHNSSPNSFLKTHKNNSKIILKST